MLWSISRSAQSIIGKLRDRNPLDLRDNFANPQVLDSQTGCKFVDFEGRTAPRTRREIPASAMTNLSLLKLRLGKDPKTVRYSDFDGYKA